MKRFFRGLVTIFVALIALPKWVIFAINEDWEWNKKCEEYHKQKTING